MRPVRHTSLARSRAGFSFIEVLAAMVVLLIGIVGILGMLTASMRHNRRAMDTSIAAYIAQMKAEEIRRDDNASGDMISEIAGLVTPTTPVTYPLDSRFAYSYCGVSLLDPVDDPGNAEDDAGVARIIVQYDAAYRSSAEVLFELRFDE